MSPRYSCEGRGGAEVKGEGEGETAGEKKWEKAGILVCFIIEIMVLHTAESLWVFKLKKWKGKSFRIL